MSMMSGLALAGQGYLLDLDMTLTPAKAIIAVLPSASQAEEHSSHPDQVILECDVAPELTAELARLNRCYPVSEGVQVRFSACYDRFGACHAGQHEADPTNLLTLKSRLMQVSAWRQDSRALQI